jgi:hypothetical protein
MIARLYKGAIKQGMDKEITIDQFLLFDDIVANKIEIIKDDKEGNKIVKMPMNELIKSDIDYIINTFN